MQFCQHLLLKLKMLPEHFRSSSVRRGKKQHEHVLLYPPEENSLQVSFYDDTNKRRGFLSKVLGEALTSPASSDIGWKDNKEIKVRLCGESLLADRITVLFCCVKFSVFLVIVF